MESGSEGDLLDLTCGRKREMAKSPVPVTRSPRRSPKRSDTRLQVRAAEIDGTIIRDRLEQLRGESTSVTESIDYTTRRVLRPGHTWTGRTERYIKVGGEW